jgi:hypothetical protein
MAAVVLTLLFPSLAIWEATGNQAKGFRTIQNR